MSFSNFLLCHATKAGRGDRAHRLGIVGSIATEGSSSSFPISARATSPTTPTTCSRWIAKRSTIKCLDVNPIRKVFGLVLGLGFQAELPKHESGLEVSHLIVTTFFRPNLPTLHQGRHTRRGKPGGNWLRCLSMIRSDVCLGC